jgi:hypothetical protein
VAPKVTQQPAEPLEVMIGAPANANSNQRFLTAEAFRAAGFHVVGMLNEPSAGDAVVAARRCEGVQEVLADEAADEKGGAAEDQPEGERMPDGF